MKESIRKHPESSERANWHKDVPSVARAILYVTKYQLYCQQGTGVYHISRLKGDCEETDIHSVITIHSSNLIHCNSFTHSKTKQNKARNVCG